MIPTIVCVAVRSIERSVNWHKLTTPSYIYIYVGVSIFGPSYATKFCVYEVSNTNDNGFSTLGVWDIGISEGNSSPKPQGSLRLCTPSSYIRMHWAPLRFRFRSTISSDGCHCIPRTEFVGNLADICEVPVPPRLWYNIGRLADMGCSGWREVRCVQCTRCRDSWYNSHLGHNHHRVL